MSNSVKSDVIVKVNMVSLGVKIHVEVTTVHGSNSACNLNGNFDYDSDESGVSKSVKITFVVYFEGTMSVTYSGNA